MLLHNVKYPRTLDHMGDKFSADLEKSSQVHHKYYTTA